MELQIDLVAKEKNESINDRISIPISKDLKIKIDHIKKFQNRYDVNDLFRNAIKQITKKIEDSV
jgi:hypothetical protein